MDISFIIPCFNEVDNVPQLKEELLPVLIELSKRSSIELIFVDDGSVDLTSEAIKESFFTTDYQNIEIKLEQHVGNWGLGKALLTGFESSSGDIIVTMDSDGTYKYATLPDLLSVLEPDIDIVTASPYHPSGHVDGVPEHRLILSRGSSLIYRLLVAWNIHTYTCLYRAYRRDVIKDVNFISHSFLAGTEMLVKCILKGYRVDEFPTTLFARSYGVSKAKLYRTIMAHLRFQFSVLLHKLHILSLVDIRDRKQLGWFRTKYIPGGTQKK